MIGKTFYLIKIIIDMLIFIQKLLHHMPSREKHVELPQSEGGGGQHSLRVLIIDRYLLNLGTRNQVCTLL